VPSISYWHRLEPRPRTDDLAPALAARVRDALWLLGRQWQLGEFRGEDAASPAWVHLEASVSPFVTWSVTEGSTAPYDGSRPLDAAIEAEPWTPTLALRTELGQVFEDLLDEHEVIGLVDAFRADYAIPAVPEAELAADPDAGAARFRRVVMGRAIDGVAVLDAALASLPGLPPKPAGIPPGQVDGVREALQALVDWVRDVYGEVGRRDAASWDPRRLEYAASATAGEAGPSTVTLRVVPQRTGALDWTTFDVAAAAGAPPPELPPAERLSRSLLPIHVRFRGMPNARWWDFEDARIDLGRLTPDRRDVGKLLVMDFMLVHGNDWFAVPFPMKSGRLCRIESLVVHDVFGGTTLVPRADRSSTSSATPATERWTLFSTAARGGDLAVAGFFVLAPSAGPASQVGAPLEDVRFLRDEMANMAWAVEHTLEGEAGRALDGRDRDEARNAEPPAPTPRPDPDAPPLRYRIQTRVPENWIPFLPVLVDPQRGSIDLERAAMLRPDPAGGPPQPIPPQGRVLQPTAVPAGEDYRVFEEEVTRSGVRVVRVPVRARWVDGATYLWIARRKLAGRGEGSSGLKYDLADPNA
jgi:hypothetical protein